MSCFEIVVGDVLVRVNKDGKHQLTTQDINEAKRFVEFIKNKVDTEQVVKKETENI